MDLRFLKGNSVNHYQDEMKEGTFYYIEDEKRFLINDMEIQDTNAVKEELNENINLDIASMDSPQNIDPALWKADNSPTPTVSISGTQKQFLTDFYTWTKAVHDRYILHIGDYVAVQKLGNNSYLILEKVQKVEQ